MTIELNLTSDSRIEFGFGTVTAGKEEWMYGEYFPAMGPTMAEHGLSILAAFTIADTNFAGIRPQSGSFASWPSAEKRQALHNDPKFVAIRPERDAAMDVLSGGHLFQSMDEVVTLNTDSDYAIIIAKEDDGISNPIFALPLADDSPEQTYAGKSIMLRPWTEADQQLLSTPSGDVEVFRIRFGGAG
ncbi:MAG: hypothetical protein NXI27_10980 [Alphaproteobacteria bacterium]|nr:hypothetical protein [Alphaproteobacteria bacterium]